MTLDLTAFFDPQANERDARIANRRAQRDAVRAAAAAAQSRGAVNPAALARMQADQIAALQGQAADRLVAARGRDRQAEAGAVQGLIGTGLGVAGTIAGMAGAGGGGGGGGLGDVGRGAASLATDAAGLNATPQPSRAPTTAPVVRAPEGGQVGAQPAQPAAPVEVAPVAAQATPLQAQPNSSGLVPAAGRPVGNQLRPEDEDEDLLGPLGPIMSRGGRF